MQTFYIMDKYKAVVSDGETYMSANEVARMLGLGRSAVDNAFNRAVGNGLIKSEEKVRIAVDGSRRKVSHYSLHAIIYIAMRSTSNPNVIAFQDWVTEITKKAFYKAFNK